MILGNRKSSSIVHTSTRLHQTQVIQIYIMTFQRASGLFSSTLSFQCSSMVSDIHFRAGLDTCKEHKLGVPVKLTWSAPQSSRPPRLLNSYWSQFKRFIQNLLSDFHTQIWYSFQRPSTRYIVVKVRALDTCLLTWTTDLIAHSAYSSILSPDDHLWEVKIVWRCLLAQSIHQKRKGQSERPLTWKRNQKRS